MTEYEKYDIVSANCPEYNYSCLDTFDLYQKASILKIIREWISEHKEAHKNKKRVKSLTNPNSKSKY